MPRNRIRFTGYVELPDAATLDESSYPFGTIVRAEVVGEIDRFTTDRNKQKGGDVSTIHGARATIDTERSVLIATEPPSEQPALGESDEPDEAETADD